MQIGAVESPHRGLWIQSRLSGRAPCCFFGSGLLATLDPHRPPIRLSPIFSQRFRASAATFSVVNRSSLSVGVWGRQAVCLQCMKVEDGSKVWRRAVYCVEGREDSRPGEFAFSVLGLGDIHRKGSSAQLQLRMGCAFLGQSAVVFRRLVCRVCGRCAMASFEGEIWGCKS